MPEKTTGEFFAFGVGSTVAGIIAQEKEGQRQICFDSELPTKGCNPEVMKAWGIETSPKEGDLLFVQAKLPLDWKKVPTTHSMYVDLVDDKGRKRASIFSKAAFYDRDAFMSLLPRFNVQVIWDDFDEDRDHCVPTITDGGKTVWRGKKVYIGKEGTSKASNVGIERLAKILPDHADVTKNWDIEAPDFGKWGSQPPVGQIYIYSVSLRNKDGDFVDSGSHEYFCRDDEHAKKKITAKIEKAFAGRYNVAFAIRCDKREVHSGEFRLPEPKPKRSYLGLDGRVMIEFDDGTVRTDDYGGFDDFGRRWR
jgi:hypothetical protein